MPRVAVAALIVLAVLPSAACRQSPPDVPRPAVIPSESPAPSAVIPTESEPPDAPSPSGITPIRGGKAADSAALRVASMWAQNANSQSFADPQPATWTRRTAQLVTGRQREQEASVRDGGGGELWRTIQLRRCTYALRGMRATVPREAPRTSTTRVVYLAAQSELICQDGTVQHQPFAAQVFVSLTGGHWLVEDVRQ